MNTFASYQSSVVFNQMHTIYNTSRISQNTFRFMDGPPFVTGNLHMGHLAIGSLKSSILNYKNMLGFACLNKLGYDCHGVPIESIVNRELNITSLEQLKEIGIEKFNQHCKDSIHRFEGDWKPIYERIGRWADFTNTYKTMDKNFMESVWWGFSELYKKGLIYRGYKITPYSYALQSPLSNFEANEGMKEIDTRSIYVRFKVKEQENTLVLLGSTSDVENNTYFVAWTTTPWTLPSNIVLCVNASLDYEYVEDESGDIYIVGKDKHKNCNIKTKSIIKTVKGAELVGMKYHPLFPYFESTPNSEKYHVVVADNYVTDSGTTGTDIVHIAPMFGEDDMRVCIEKNIITRFDMLDLESVDENCKYLPKITKYMNLLVFDAETQIIKDLKEQKCVLRTQQIRHSYPHCYRTDTPLVYKSCESFYVDIQKIKQRMCELNSEINWIPSNIGSERFYNWIFNAKDWCISRSRCFGNPIPAWISDDGKLKIIGSISELEELTKQKFDDIHPEFINDITFEIDGHVYRKIPDVFDCWFESGSVPFAQYHYPFENEHIFDNHDSMSSFICEGIDQTRGWFYTLLILSVALFDKKPSDNILVVGHILDENKKKFSKKTKNYVDPNILIDRYGSDSIRLYLLQSPITHAEPLAFKEDDIKLLSKDLYQFKNCVDFLKEHTENQKHQGIIFDKDIYKSSSIDNSMDIWIMQHIQNSGAQVIEYMNSYNVSKAVRIIIDLIEDITNWYLKFNRDRLKGKCGNDEWIKSTSVLNYVINCYVNMLAPFAPFISEKIYRDLEHLHGDKDMVHKKIYEFTSVSDTTYIETFDLLKRVSRLVRSARMNTKTHTSSKTPIKYCEICMDSDIQIKQIESCIDLIQSELNVLDIKYSKLTENIKYKYVPNKALLGKKYKKFANEIYKFFEKSDLQETENQIILYIDGKIYEILSDEYIKEPVFRRDDIFEKDILIKIDFTYDEHINKMSHLKRFVSDIQQTRKIMGLHPWNKISIEVERDDFDIVSDNIEYMKKRLECEVNPVSLIKGDRIYEDEDKKIKYSVRLL